MHARRIVPVMIAAFVVASLIAAALSQRASAATDISGA